jgi:hypothetical protein
LGIVFAGAASTAPAKTPRATTVTSFPGVARELAIGPRDVAWIDSASALHVRTLKAGRETLLVYTDPSKEFKRSDVFPRLAVSAHTVAWLSVRALGNDGEVDRVYSAPASNLRARHTATYVHAEGSTGDYVFGVAADAGGVSYGVARLTAVEPEETSTTLSGGTWSVGSGAPHRLLGAPPGFVLARADGWIAIEPARVAASAPLVVSGTGFVEIRDAASGALVSTLRPGGTTPFFPENLHAVALTARIGVILVNDVFDRFDIATGKLLGSTPAPYGTVPQLGVAAGQVVFQDGSDIWGLDPTSGRLRVVMRPSGPWGIDRVAANGTTVIWAESQQIAPGEPSRKTYKSRIRRFTLSR